MGGATRSANDKTFATNLSSNEQEVICLTAVEMFDSSRVDGQNS